MTKSSVSAKALANELGLSLDELVDLAKSVGIEVASPDTLLRPGQVRRIETARKRQVGTVAPPTPRGPRVYEIAKEFGLGSAQVLERAAALGIVATSHFARLSPEEAAALRAALGGEAGAAAPSTVPPSGELFSEASPPEKGDGTQREPGPTGQGAPAPSGRVRIHELARTLGVPSAKVLTACAELGISAKSNLSKIDESDAERLRAYFSEGAPTGTSPERVASEAARTVQPVEEKRAAGSAAPSESEGAGAGAERPEATAAGERVAGGVKVGEPTHAAPQAASEAKERDALSDAERAVGLGAEKASAAPPPKAGEVIDLRSAAGGRRSRGRKAAVIPLPRAESSGPKVVPPPGATIDLRAGRKERDGAGARGARKEAPTAEKGRAPQTTSTPSPRRAKERKPSATEERPRESKEPQGATPRPEEVARTAAPVETAAPAAPTEAAAPAAAGDKPAEELGGEPKPIDISVAVVARRGQASNLSAVLEALASQRLPWEVELAVVDAEVGKRAAEAAKRAGASLAHISRDASQARALAAAAEVTRGELLVLLDASVAPGSDEWLKRLTDDLFEDTAGAIAVLSAPVRPAGRPGPSGRGRTFFAGGDFDPARAPFEETVIVARRSILEKVPPAEARGDLRRWLRLVKEAGGAYRWQPQVVGRLVGAPRKGRRAATAQGESTSSVESEPSGAKRAPAAKPAGAKPAEAKPAASGGESAPPAGAKPAEAKAAASGGAPASKAEPERPREVAAAAATPGAGTVGAPPRWESRGGAEAPQASPAAAPEERMAHEEEAEERPWWALPFEVAYRTAERWVHIATGLEERTVGNVLKAPLRAIRDVLEESRQSNR